MNGGHTIIDYNTNTITRVTSTIIGQQYGITEYESVPIREWLPTIDHYSLHIQCSICFCNSQGFIFIIPFFPQISNRPWINLFGWLPSSWFDNFLEIFFEFFTLPYTGVGGIVDTSKILLIIISSIKKLILMVKKALSARVKIIKQ